MSKASFRLALSKRRTQPVLPSAGYPNSALPPALITAWQQEIDDKVQPMIQSLAELRQAFQPATDEGSWEEIAHSLVVGFLLAHVGGLQFLKLASLGAASLELPEQASECLALSFLRLSPVLGISHIIGGPYPDGWQVRQALQQPGVSASLASHDAEYGMVMQGNAPSALEQLNAYVYQSRAAFTPGIYRLKIPVLSPASLTSATPGIERFCHHLQETWQSLVAIAQQQLVPSEMTTGHWLCLYAQGTALLATAIVERAALPPVVGCGERKASLFARWRRPGSDQQPPTGLCIWKDVDALWDLGHRLV